jgi:hypothetical protein
LDEQVLVAEALAVFVLVVRPVIGRIQEDETGRVLPPLDSIEIGGQDDVEHLGGFLSSKGRELDAPRLGVAADVGPELVEGFAFTTAGIDEPRALRVAEPGGDELHLARRCRVVQEFGLSFLACHFRLLCPW